MGSKVVIQLNKNDQPVKLWKNANTAAKNLHITRGVMSHILHGNMKHFNNMHFRYATPLEIETYGGLYGIETCTFTEPVIEMTPAIENSDPIAHLPASEISAAPPKPSYDEITLSPFEQILKRVREQKI